MTKKEFDPYHRWLGIPASEQPANHYRLLGLALFEADADVIESAAIRQITHVRSHALGSHGDTTQTVLSEIAEAKITLLHPEKKKQYDEGLRSAAKANEDSPLDVFIQKNVTATSSSAKQTSSKTDRWKNAKQLRQAYVAASAGWICFVLALMWIGFGKEPASKATARPGIQQEEKISQTKSKPPAPKAIAPFDSTKAKKYQGAWADYLGVPVETSNSIGMKLKVIPAGTFTMVDRYRSTAHKVTLSQPFMLGVHEVTEEQFAKVMGFNPSGLSFKGAQYPVEQVSWTEAMEFCRKLSALPEERAAGRVYRLPTEAQWEYACRGGTTTEYGFGGEFSDLGQYAWYSSNSGNQRHPVGQKQPNAWGLYDMHGNVWEWCSDWYDKYPSGGVTDPAGAQSGSYRVRRGGSWYDSDEYCRSAFRNGVIPSSRFISNGFRVTCVPSGQ